MAETNFFDSFKKGEMPTFPVALSVDTPTLVSLAAVAVIIVTIVLLFKKHK